VSNQVEINAQAVVDNLLEQNKQLTLEVAILKSVIGDLEEMLDNGQATGYSQE
jgi:hypothetical protein